jgi:hypothetical protein
MQSVAAQQLLIRRKGLHIVCVLSPGCRIVNIYRAILALAAMASNPLLLGAARGAYFSQKQATGRDEFLSARKGASDDE